MHLSDWKASPKAWRGLLQAGNHILPHLQKEELVLTVTVELKVCEVEQFAQEDTQLLLYPGSVRLGPCPPLAAVQKL